MQENLTLDDETFEVDDEDEDEEEGSRSGEEGDDEREDEYQEDTDIPDEVIFDEPVQASGDAKKKKKGSKIFSDTFSNNY